MRLIDRQPHPTPGVPPVHPEIAIEAVHIVLVGLVQHRFGIQEHLDDAVAFGDGRLIVALPQCDTHRPVPLRREAQLQGFKQQFRGLLGVYELVLHLDIRFPGMGDNAATQLEEAGPVRPAMLAPHFDNSAQRSCLLDRDLHRGRLTGHLAGVRPQPVAAERRAPEQRTSIQHHVPDGQVAVGRHREAQWPGIHLHASRDRLDPYRRGRHVPVCRRGLGSRQQAQGLVPVAGQIGLQGHVEPLDATIRPGGQNARLDRIDHASVRIFCGDRFANAKGPGAKGHTERYGLGGALVTGDLFKVQCADHRRLPSIFGVHAAPPHERAPLSTGTRTSPGGRQKWPPQQRATQMGTCWRRCGPRRCRR